MKHTKKIVDESVEEFVHHCFAGKVGDGFEAVVDVEGGDHHEEAW